MYKSPKNDSLEGIGGQKKLRDGEKEKEETLVNYTIDLSLEQEEENKNDEVDEKTRKSGDKIFDDS